MSRHIYWCHVIGRREAERKRKEEEFVQRSQQSCRCLVSLGLGTVEWAWEVFKRFNFHKILTHPLNRPIATSPPSNPPKHSNTNAIRQRLSKVVEVYGGYLALFVASLGWVVHQEAGDDEEGEEGSEDAAVDEEVARDGGGQREQGAEPKMVGPVVLHLEWTLLSWL